MIKSYITREIKILGIVSLIMLINVYCFSYNYELKGPFVILNKSLANQTAEFLFNCKYLISIIMILVNIFKKFIFGKFELGYFNGIEYLLINTLSLLYVVFIDSSHPITVYLVYILVSYMFYKFNIEKVYNRQFVNLIKENKERR